MIYVQAGLFDGNLHVNLKETYYLPELDRIDIPPCSDCRHVKHEDDHPYYGYFCKLLKMDVDHAGHCNGHEFPSPEHAEEYWRWAQNKRRKL